MRVLTMDEMKAVCGGGHMDKDGGYHMDQISISHEHADPDGHGHDAPGWGHSIAHKSNIDPVTGFPVLRGQKGDRTPSTEARIKEIGLNVGIPGIASGTVTIEPIRRGVDHHN